MQEKRAVRGKLYVRFIHIDIRIYNKCPKSFKIDKPINGKFFFQGKPGPRGLIGKDGVRGEKVINCCGMN